jgi:hypothetical protein
LTVPDTGGWQNWQTVSTTVSLAAGAQTARLVMDAGGTYAVGNFDWMRFTAGGSAPPPQVPEVVIYASDVPAANLHGAWTKASDATSPNGIKLVTPDNGSPTANAPLASPTDYVDVTFTADANKPYAVWLRMKALNNNKFNDSIWVQFSDALAGGATIYPLNSTSGLSVNLATDAGASSLSNWGWQNGSYWLTQSTTISFASGGAHTIRIQTREDGVQFDQIVLSGAHYLTASPGSVSNDSKIVPKP